MPAANSLIWTIPQCSWQIYLYAPICNINGCMQNGALWCMGLMHCDICATGLLTMWEGTYLLSLGRELINLLYLTLQCWGIAENADILWLIWLFWSRALEAPVTRSSRTSWCFLFRVGYWLKDLKLLPSHTSMGDHSSVHPVCSWTHLRWELISLGQEGCSNR